MLEKAFEVWCEAATQVTFSVLSCPNARDAKEHRFRYSVKNGSFPYVG